MEKGFEVPDRMVVTNSVAYSILINGLCNEGRIEAMNMVEEMTEKVTEPTVYTYAVPISG